MEWPICSCKITDVLLYILIITSSSLLYSRRLTPQCLYIVTSIQVALLVSATVGVASLDLLASHRMPTQCLSIIEVIKLSGRRGISR